MASNSRAVSATVRPIGPARRGRPADQAQLVRHRARARDGNRRRRNTPRDCAGAAHVGAGRERHHAGRQRHRRAAGRAGAGLLGVERIAGRAVHRVHGIGAGAELGRVGLADHDRAGLRTAATWRSSASGTNSANCGEPNVVRRSAVTARSLMTMGRPCRAPSASPSSPPAPPPAPPPRRAPSRSRRRR